MAEKASVNQPKELIEAVPEEMSKIKIETVEERSFDEKARDKILDSWIPKTELGKAVKAGKSNYERAYGSRLRATLRDRKSEGV